MCAPFTTPKPPHALKARKAISYPSNSLRPFVRMLFALGCVCGLCHTRADSLVLDNGDRMRGAIREIESRQLTFSPAWSDAPLQFALDEARVLRFGEPAPFEETPPHLLALDNGDLLRATVLEENDADLRLRLSWGQELTLARERIARVSTNQNLATSIVESSTLQIESNGMSYRRPESFSQEFEGVWLGRGWRAVHSLEDLPSAITLEFHLQETEARGFGLRLFIPDPRAAPSLGINVVVQENRIILQWVGEVDGERRRERHDIPFPENSAASPGLYRFEINREKETLSFALDGQRLAEDLSIAGFSFPDTSLVVVNPASHPVVWKDFRFAENTPDFHDLPEVHADPDRFRLRTSGGMDFLTLESFSLDGDQLVTELDGFSEPLRVPRAHVSVLRRGDKAPASPEGNLTLRNGDQIHGKLVGADSSGLLVDAPWSPDPFAISPQNVREWRTPERVRQAAAAPVRVLFENAYSISGVITGMDAETLRLETPWGQELRFPTERVSKIQHEGRDDEFDGLARPDRWRLNSITPPDRDILPRRIPGEIAFPGLQGHNMVLNLPRLPERFLLEFSVLSSRPEPRYRVALLPRANSHPTRNSLFGLQVLPEMLRQQTRGSNNVNVNWNMQVPRFGRYQHMELYVDQERSMMHLFLNGEFLREWNMARAPGSRYTDRTAFLMHSFNSPPFRLQDLRMREWNGHLPRPTGGEGDIVVRLRNGEVLRVKALGWEDDRYQLVLEGDRTINLPTAVMERVFLRPVRPPGSRLRRNELETVSHEHGFRLPLRFTGMEGEALLGQSPLTHDTLLVPLDSVHLLCSGSR